jgi:hypothetical protein
MADISELIDRLAADCRPLRPLRPPLVRAASWLALAIAVVAVVTAIHGPRPDLAAQFVRADVVLAFVAALLTGVAAAVAAFTVSIPGRSPAWSLLPAPALGLWLLSLGWGCFNDWVRLGPDGLALGRSVSCLEAILAISIPLGLILLVMVRHAGFVRPRATAFLGALAVSALASAGVTFFHDLDTALMVLMWHLAPATLLSLGSWAAGRRLFAWIGVSPA